MSITFESTPVGRTEPGEWYDQVFKALEVGAEAAHTVFARIAKNHLRKGLDVAGMAMAPESDEVLWVFQHSVLCTKSEDPRYLHALLDATVSSIKETHEVARGSLFLIESLYTRVHEASPGAYLFTVKQRYTFR